MMCRSIPNAASLGKAFAAGGYDTAYIGKWHVDGHGRDAPIPPERRQGFQFWKVLECTHDYGHSAYYDGDSDTPRTWDGYDAIAQTREAQRYIRERKRRDPFLLVLSWGPPHNPYRTAPEPYRSWYDRAPIRRRPNVPMNTWVTAYDSLAGLLRPLLGPRCVRRRPAADGRRGRDRRRHHLHLHLRPRRRGGVSRPRQQTGAVG